MSLFLTPLLVALFIELVAFIYYKKTNNPTIVDVAWPLAILGASLVTTNDISNTTSSLLILWALRLALYIFITRVRSGHIDPRYEFLSSDAQSKDIYFLKNFVLQGALATGVASVFCIPLPLSQTLTYFVYLGNLITLIGLVIETLADWQLFQHKLQSKELCTTGLWAYSRHPNLAGDLLVWVGFSISMLDQNWLSATGAVFLWYIMHHITIPITEELSMKRRGDAYKEYQDKVPKWF